MNRLQELPEHLTARALVMSSEPDGERLALLLRRVQNDAFRGGELDLPGGGAHGGELPVDTAVRETFEESGLQLAADSLYLFYDKSQVGERGGRLVNIRRQVYAGYLTTPADATPVVLSAEHSAYGWYPLPDAVTAIGSPHYSEAVANYLQMPSALLAGAVMLDA